jgi:putative oxidoreductase
MTEQRKIEWALLLLRVGVFVVMAVWTADKFLHPEHAMGVFRNFYFLDIHVSTFASWNQYTVDINLLFFAAWPMLAACVALYVLRDMDRKCSF